MKRLLLAMISVLCLGSSTSIFADSLDEAYQAFNSKDFKKAAEIMRPLAVNGDPNAQDALGFLYPPTLAFVSGIYGKDGIVPKDLVESLKWTILAANRGHKGSQEFLGWYKDKLSPEQIKKAKNEASAWADTHWKNFYPLLGSIGKR